MWPWDPEVEGSWTCAVALFTLIVELSDKAQPINKPITSKLNSRRPKETNLYKWSRFPRERFMIQTVFARSSLEDKIKSIPLEIQQIIVTKVWENRTVATSVNETGDCSNFLEKDFMLSQYLEHVLLAPQGEQLIEDACEALKRIENVALGIYSAEVKNV